jgi:hypothetical protein
LKAAEISAGVIFCSVLFSDVVFSDVAFTEGVVLFDALLAVTNLFSFILTGVDLVALTAAVVAVLFPAVAALLDDKVTGTVAALLCFVLASVVVTACVDGLVDVEWLSFVVASASTLLPVVAPGLIPLLGL